MDQITEIITFLAQYEKSILFCLSILAILILYFILSRSLTKYAKNNPNVFFDNLNTGIKLFSRLFAGYFIIVTIGLYFNLTQNVVLLLTGLVATIVSLSSIQVINNFFAGLVLLILKPFEVDDYININGFEGRVTKITLNFTKMITLNNAFVLLPNGTILHSDLVNYTLRKKGEKKDNSFLLNPQEFLSQFTGSKVTKYNFSLALELTSLPTVLPKLKNVCLEYKKIFGYEPDFFLYDLGWKVSYQFQIISDEAEIIRTNLKEFRNTLLKTAYP